MTPEQIAEVQALPKLLVLDQQGTPLGHSPVQQTGPGTHYLMLLSHQDDQLLMSARDVDHVLGCPRCPTHIIEAVKAGVQAWFAERVTETAEPTVRLVSRWEPRSVLPPEVAAVLSLLRQAGVSIELVEVTDQGMFRLDENLRRADRLDEES